MSFQKFFVAARAFALVSFLASSGPVSALTGAATVRDGNSIQLGDVTYRLDGVDAPELDQVCIDNHADTWTCGIEARDQLAKLINKRTVRCDDVGPEKSFGKRHRAICTAEGDKASLNEQLIKLGFALAREPIKANVKPAATEAKTAAAGIWKGCFVAPQDFRSGKKDGALLGRRLPGRPRQGDPRRAVSGGADHAAQLQHQGQARSARPRHREYRHLPSAGMPELSRDHETGPLVLLGGRRPGGRLPQGL
jgi:endonuclease YncB( thermonuclease family)